MKLDKRPRRRAPRGKTHGSGAIALTPLGVAFALGGRGRGLGRGEVVGMRAISLALAAVALLAVVALGLLAEPSLAAGTTDIGRNVGNMTSAWAKAILLGIAGLVAIPVLAKRDVSGGLVLAGLVLIVGGFVFAPGAVTHAVTGLWHTIAG